MRVCIRVFGIVQGVGFRPTVKRHADACDIAGSVSNKGPYRVRMVFIKLNLKQTPKKSSKS